MSIPQMGQKLEGGAWRFEQGFTGCIDSLEDHIATARQKRLTRRLLRACAALVTLVFFAAAFLLAAVGDNTVSSLCAVAGAGLGTFSALVLFVFPSGE